MIFHLVAPASDENRQRTLLAAVCHAGIEVSVTGTTIQGEFCTARGYIGGDVRDHMGNESEFLSVWLSNSLRGSRPECAMFRLSDVRYVESIDTPRMR